MTAGAVAAEAAGDQRKYARFSRRLRGMMIDTMVFLVAMVVALQVAVAFNSNDLARIVGFSFLAGFFLYEPLMVWLAGGTVGHYLSNLRVVDDRTNGNVSLLKAFGRVAIKTVLGAVSFIIMTAARRHQAIHDLLTRSTVQIRDPTKALPSHYGRERVELSSPGMPGRWRRIVVTTGYAMAVYLVMALAVVGLHFAGVLSHACFQYDRCSPGETVAKGVVGLAFIVALAVCIGLGWRGRLWGARRRVVSA